MVGCDVHMCVVLLFCCDTHKLGRSCFQAERPSYAIDPHSISKCTHKLHTSISKADVGVHAGARLRRERIRLNANIIRKHTVAYVPLNG